MNRDAALPSSRLSAGVSLPQAVPWHATPVTLASPALEVMTDLTRTKAATTSPETTLRQAEHLMIYQGVRMLFVVTDMPSIEGLVTTNDLHGGRAMQVVQQRGTRFEELIVADVMTPLALLDAIDFATLRNAHVSNVVTTFKRLGRNHLLVTEQASPHTPWRVRGVISRSQVERQLGEPIDITPIAGSFSEIERALA